ncbi:hypothetical protein ACIHCQ_06400 [Streptomyces sp. NPDC052236]|uniref:hypothetical protein n=1 Tax=Streptomyces sp. NPDC052236 TaxID=3365686 RepID=UPI0037D85535
MNTFLSYLVVLALAVLVLLPSLVGHARDRAIDRQLRQAERPAPTTVPTTAVPRSGRAAATRRQELAHKRYAV